MKSSNHISLKESSSILGLYFTKHFYFTDHGHTRQGLKDECEDIVLRCTTKDVVIWEYKVSFDFFDDVWL